MTKRASSENKEPTGDNGGIKLMPKLDYSPGNLAESNDAHHRWVPGKGSSSVIDEGRGTVAAPHRAACPSLGQGGILTVSI